jgi:hypothetical protein
MNTEQLNTEENHQTEDPFIWQMPQRPGSKSRQNLKFARRFAMLPMYAKSF